MMVLPMTALEAWQKAIMATGSDESHANQFG